MIVQRWAAAAASVANVQPAGANSVHVVNGAAVTVQSVANHAAETIVISDNGSYSTNYYVVWARPATLDGPLFFQDRHREPRDCDEGVLVISNLNIPDLCAFPKMQRLGRGYDKTMARRLDMIDV